MVSIVTSLIPFILSIGSAEEILFVYGHMKNSVTRSGQSIIAHAAERTIPTLSVQYLHCGQLAFKKKLTMGKMYAKNLMTPYLMFLSVGNLLGTNVAPRVIMLIMTIQQKKLQ